MIPDIITYEVHFINKIYEVGAKTKVIDINGTLLVFTLRTPEGYIEKLLDFIGIKEKIARVEDVNYTFSIEKKKRGKIANTYTVNIKKIVGYEQVYTCVCFKNVKMSSSKYFVVPPNMLNNFRYSNGFNEFAFIPYAFIRYYNDGIDIRNEIVKGEEESIYILAGYIDTSKLEEVIPKIEFLEDPAGRSMKIHEGLIAMNYKSKSTTYVEPIQLYDYIIDMLTERGKLENQILKLTYPYVDKDRYGTFRDPRLFVLFDIFDVDFTERNISHINTFILNIPIPQDIVISNAFKYLGRTYPRRGLDGLIRHITLANRLETMV